MSYECYDAEMRAKRAHYMDNYGQGDNWQVEGARLHQEYYSWVADYIGATERHLPVSRKQLRESTDPSFNDIRLKLWDDCHPRMLALARKRGVAKGWSIGDTVCTLKAIARRALDQNPGPRGCKVDAPEADPTVYRCPCGAHCPTCEKP